MLKNNLYPFAAVVGQEEAKKALLIALVNRRAGGLLIGGAKGTAKSVLARSVQSLIGAQRMLTLPLNVTEDMLFGSIDLEAAVSLGEKRFSPGILARATDNILYIDEANLLRQELLTAALDANSAGINNVERDGISCSHEVRTTVIATMNPEEGTLPGHILDRFGMYADMQALQDIGQRVEVIQRALAYSNNTLAFCEQYAEETAALAAKVQAARELLPQVEVSDAMLMLAAQLCSQAFCAGHRAEIYLLEAARAIAAMAGRAYVLPKDVEEAAQFVLPHRMRKPPEQQPEEQEQQDDNQNEDENEQDNEDNPDDDNNARTTKITSYRHHRHWITAMMTKMTMLLTMRTRMTKATRTSSSRSVIITTWHRRSSLPISTKASVCRRCCWIWARTAMCAVVAANAA